MPRLLFQPACHLLFPPPKAGISRLTVLALVSRAPRLQITLETLPDLGPWWEGGGKGDLG